MVNDVAVLIDRAEMAIAKIEEVHIALRRCQAHCWVGTYTRGEVKWFLATFLVACAGACFGTLLGR
jgi:hypothetical protein